MKRVLILFLASFLLSSLCACGEVGDSKTQESNKVEVSIEKEDKTLTDFNEETNLDNKETTNIDDSNGTTEKFDKETKEDDNEKEVIAKEKVECIREIEYGDGYKVCILKEIPDNIGFKDYKKDTDNQIVMIDVPMDDVYAFSTKEGNTRVTVLCDGYVAAFIDGSLVEEYILDAENGTSGYVAKPFTLDNYPFPEDIGAEKFIGAPVLIVSK